MVEASSLGLSHLVTHRLYPVSYRLVKCMTTMIRVMIICVVCSLVDLVGSPLHCLLRPYGLALMLFVQVISILTDVGRFMILLGRSKEA